VNVVLVRHFISYGAVRGGVPERTFRRPTATDLVEAAARKRGAGTRALPSDKCDAALAGDGFRGTLPQRFPTLAQVADYRGHRGLGSRRGDDWCDHQPDE
jgi:hypothetical protein